MRGLGWIGVKWRITIGTLLIALVLATAAIGLFRAQVAQILSSTTTTLLRHDAAPYASQISANPSLTAVDEPGRGQLIAVISPSNAVIESNLPKSLDGQAARLATLPGDTSSVTEGDDTYRIYTTSVATSAGVWQIVSVRNEDSSMLSLDRITQALIVSAGVIVLGFGVASWLLTSAALRPVTRMRRQAVAIVAEGSTEPLPLGRARDELSALAVTLNEFISDVRQSVDRERQLVSDASHELRTPLAILKAQLELAHLSSGDAVALEAEIERAQASVERLSSLATGLLELSQLEAHSPEGMSSWGQLSDELVAAVDRARMLAVARSVTVDYDVSGDSTSLAWNIAPSNFGRVVDNLASNAIAALPEGGSVRIALRHSSAELVMTVVDSGAGMPDDFLPIAFDRFSRPDESRAKRSGGSGLGLAIVHAIVTAANGRVTLSNAAGFTVTVSLPAR